MKRLILFSLFLLTFSNCYSEEEIRSFTSHVGGRSIITRYRIVDGQYELIESKELTKEMLKKNQPTEPG